MKKFIDYLDTDIFTPQPDHRQAISLESKGANTQEFQTLLVETAGKLKQNIGKPEVKESLLWLSALVKDYMGLTIQFFIGRESYCLYPALLQNHPLYNVAQIAKSQDYRYLKRAMTEKNFVFKGSVDTKKFTVEGEFEGLLFAISISEDAIRDNRIAANGLAALIAHEIGHAYTWCATMHLEASTNQVLFAASQALLTPEGSSNKEVIVDIALRNAKVKNITAKDARDLSDAQVMSLIGSLSPDIRRSMLGSPEYDNTAMEQMADKFVTRIGLGMPLAFVRDYYNTKNHTVGKWSTIDYIKADLLANKTTLFSLLGFIAFQGIAAKIYYNRFAVGDNPFADKSLGYTGSLNPLKRIASFLGSTEIAVRQGVKSFKEGTVDIFKGKLFAALSGKIPANIEILLRMQYLFNYILTIKMFEGMFSMFILNPARNRAANHGLQVDYDRDLIQIKRIREDMIQQLKDKDVDPVLRKQLLYQADSIELLIKGYSDKTTSIYNPIIRLLELGPTWLVNRNNSEEIQRKLEEISANDLFLEAERFKQM